MDACRKSVICFLLFLLILTTPSFGEIFFTETELLGRPTDHSIPLTDPGSGVYKDDPPRTIVKPDSGHLRITVSPEKATVDYVRAFLPGVGPNGDIEYSYSINKDNSPSIGSKTKEETTH